jgi:Copper acquisition factor BIM1-like
MHTRHRLSALIGLLMGTSTVVAAAHVRLEFPIPRYPIPALEDGSNLKQAPCGTVGDHRTTDPSRISTFRPGEAITVRFKETIDHPGHYRIAFDDDGQDAFVEPASFTDIQAAPVLPILQDGIADKAGGEYQVNITLPNVECTNCTLQLIQVMTDKAPYVVNTDDVYHQCADIVLSSGATTTDAGTGSDGDAGAAGGATDGGCSCRAGRPLGGGVWSAVGLACIGLLLQRGRRRTLSR